jgi:group I intron endonuclease
MYYGFIYEWTNTLNNKKYIGSHAGTIEDGYIGSGKVFQWAIKKYGIENFTRIILEYVDVADRQFLLEREKYYLDQTNAYHSTEYYNVAMDVIGGNTKAGWSEERRQQFKQQIKDVWANRTDEEKQEILSRTHSKTKEWFQSEEGEAFKQQQRESFHSKKDKIIEGIKNRDPEDRKRSARLGKERMGEKRRKEAAQKAAASWTEETKINAKQKAQETRANWTEEKRNEVFENSSRGRKGKCAGSENGRARKIVAESRTFDTLKDAMLQLNISEYKLHTRLKDPNNNEYYYL